MRKTITDAEFWEQLATFDRSAWRFEHQPTYDVSYEQQQFQDFLDGNPKPPTDTPALADWFSQVQRQVAEGKTVGRLRVIDEPPTDYQRWMLWIDPFSRQFGETIDYLTRKEALAVGLPAEGSDEWWLFDDKRLMLVHHDEHGSVMQVELLVDEPEVEQALAIRETALRLTRRTPLAMTGPPVVFVSQVGTSGDSWAAVVDQMSSKAVTVTYDRPGTGDAPPRASAEPLPYSAFADELAELLDRRSITEPAVLVGHSVGSLIARVFAHRHPHRVAGMVHVDGSIPRLRFGPGLQTEPPVDGDVPGSTPFDMLTGEAEVINADLPNVPGAVIRATPGLWPAEGGWAPFEDLWDAYQRQLARHYRTPLVVALNAGHQIPREAPRLVAFVVDEVVEAVRAGTPVMLDLERLAAAGGSLAKS